MQKHFALLALLALSSLSACSDKPLTQDETSRFAGEKMPAQAWTDPVLETIEKDGMIIEIFEHGTGSMAEEFDRISAHYQGWVRNTEKVFDSSFTSGNPFGFTIGGPPPQPIQGWTIGFEGMTVGTRARFQIPQNLAWGKRGQGAIPGNADVVFDVELIKVRDQ